MPTSPRWSARRPSVGGRTRPARPPRRLRSTSRSARHAASTSSCVSLANVPPITCSGQQARKAVQVAGPGAGRIDPTGAGGTTLPAEARCLVQRPVSRPDAARGKRGDRLDRSPGSSLAARHDRHDPGRPRGDGVDEHDRDNLSAKPLQHPVAKAATTSTSTRARRPRLPGAAVASPYPGEGLQRSPSEGTTSSPT